MMMIDAFQPLGITMLAVDSIFMMPHLGVLSIDYHDIAMQVFKRDCIVPLGPVIAPQGKVTEGEEVMKVLIEKSGKTDEYIVNGGELHLIELTKGETAVITIHPGKNLDMGIGRGKSITQTIEGGVVGIILDGRGRELELPQNDAARRAKINSWLRAMGE